MRAGHSYLLYYSTIVRCPVDSDPRPRTSTVHLHHPSTYNLTALPPLSLLRSSFIFSLFSILPPAPTTSEYQALIVLSRAVQPKTSSVLRLSASSRRRLRTVPCSPHPKSYYRRVLISSLVFCVEIPRIEPSVCQHLRCPRTVVGSRPGTASKSEDFITRTPL